MAVKLGFWSPYLHISGTTSNCFALANMLAKDKYLKTVIVQLDKDFTEPFKEEFFHQKTSEKVGFGEITEHLYKKVSNDDEFKKLGLEEEKRFMNDCCIPLWEYRLFYLPCTFKESVIYQEELLVDMLDDVIKRLENCFDCIILDIPSGINLIAERAITIVDKVVINLPHGKKYLNNYLENRYIVEDKSYFLFGRYDKDSINSYTNLRRLYPKIKNNFLGFIPYCTDFSDSYDSNTVSEFFLKNDKENMDKEDKLYFFIDSIINASKILYKNCDFYKSYGKYFKNVK